MKIHTLMCIVALVIPCVMHGMQSSKDEKPRYTTIEDLLCNESISDVENFIDELIKTRENQLQELRLQKIKLAKAALEQISKSKPLKTLRRTISQIKEIAYQADSENENED